MLNVETLVFNPFQENTFVIWDETRQCAIVDPGCADAHEEEQLFQFITSNNLTPAQLIITHGHVDHVLGVASVHEKYGLRPIMHLDDVNGYKAVPEYAQSFGFNNVQIVEPERHIDDGEVIEIGNSIWQVLHTPGHTPGEICLYHEDTAQLIAGDVLFLGSIGRTDLPGGDHATLISSIKEKLLCLPDDVKVYSGHGPTTSIGYERVRNPFLQ